MTRDTAYPSQPPALAHRRLQQLLRSLNHVIVRRMGWIRALLIASGAQMLIQAISFASGLLVIRSFTPRQYAFYTIANAGVGMMSVLTDSGIANAILASGGAVWRDRMRLGGVLAAGLQLRRKLAVMAMLIALPVTSYLVHTQGLDWTQATIIAASVIPMYLATVTGQLLEIVPRLHQKLASVQKIQLIATLGRLVILVPVAVALPFASAALLAVALPQWYSNIRLRRLVAKDAQWNVPVPPEAAASIRAQVVRTMPWSVYYALSSQVSVWLISIFGHGQSVAEIGALGRLGMLFALMLSIFSLVEVPRFARLDTPDRRQLITRYFSSQALLLAFCASLLLIVWLNADRVLALLGTHYSGLASELLLMCLSGVASAVAGAAYHLSAARGITTPAWMAIPVNVGLQVMLILFLKVGTTAGVLEIGLICALAQWLLSSATFLFALSKRTGTRTC